MLGEVKFFNFIDLPSLRAGGSLQKLPIEKGIKDAHLAFQKGHTQIGYNGLPIHMEVSRTKGTPYFRIPGAIHAEAWVYKNQKLDSSFVRMELGISGEEVQEDDGVGYTQTEFLTLTGRCKDAEGGDPSVFFFDPYKKKYMEGFFHALMFIDQVIGEKVKDKLGLTIPQVVGEEVLSEIHKTGVQTPWQ